MAGPSVRLLVSCVLGAFGAYRGALHRALSRPGVAGRGRRGVRAYAVGGP
jgi:hypothetical protein